MLPLPGAPSTDPSAPAIHRRGWINEKQDSFAGFEPQYPQLFFVCHHSSFQPAGISPGTHSPAPLLFQVTSMCCEAKLHQCPCLAPRLVPAHCLRVRQAQRPHWGSEGGGRTSQTRHREGRAGFDLPSSATSNSTPLLQEEVSACRPKSLQTPFKSRSYF